MNTFKALPAVDWPSTIIYLAEHLTFEQIAQQSGLASSGHVSNVKSGAQKTVTFEIGRKLLDMQRREAKRRKRLGLE